MPTAYSTLLGLALPTTGELTGTWGNVVNTEITNLLDAAIAGTTTLSADADVTLTSTTGAANQARAAILLWTAANAVTRNITAPARSKVYFVVHAGGAGAIVLRGTGPTAGITLVQGEKCIAVWNGTDFVKVASDGGTGNVLTLPQINDTSKNHQYVFGVSELAADRTVTLPLLTANDIFVFADFIQTLTNKTLVSPAITGTIGEDVYTITDGAGFAIDPTNGSVQLITLGANRTPVQANWDSGESITLMVGDGTAYSITWTTIGVVWVGGIAPVLADTGYAVIQLWKVGSTVYGARVGDVA